MRSDQQQEFLMKQNAPMPFLFQMIGVGDADDGTISVEEVPRHISANNAGKIDFERDASIP